MAKRYEQACPIATTLDLVGDRWTLLLARDLLTGPKRFQDLRDSLKGIPPNVLSLRLKGLEESEIVERRFYSDHPPRAEYLLTPKGQDLEIIIGALAAWGTRHAFRRSKLVHRSCGRPLEVHFRCARCDVDVKRGEATVRRVS